MRETERRSQPLRACFGVICLALLPSERMQEARLDTATFVGATEIDRQYGLARPDHAGLRRARAALP